MYYDFRVQASCSERNKFGETCWVHDEIVRAKSVTGAIERMYKRHYRGPSKYPYNFRVTLKTNGYQYENKEIEMNKYEVKLESKYGLADEWGYGKTVTICANDMAEAISKAYKPYFSGMEGYEYRISAHRIVESKLQKEIKETEAQLERLKTELKKNG